MGKNHFISFFLFTYNVYNKKHKLRKENVWSIYLNTLRSHRHGHWLQHDNY
jgi:hypothetical protein